MLYLFTALRVRLDSKLDHANLAALSMLLLLYKVVVASSMMCISSSRVKLLYSNLYRLLFNHRGQQNING